MAFFVEGPNPLPTRSTGDDPALDFNIENVTEDVINGLFCTYEPPTSTKSQRRAAKDAMDHPQKYKLRSRLNAKSILKYTTGKIKPKKKKNNNKTKDINKNYDNANPNTNGNGNVSDGRDDDETVATSTELTMHDNRNKTVTWRDQQPKQQEPKQHQQQQQQQPSSVDRTKLEDNVVEVADKYCGIFSQNAGEGIADLLSSPKGRAAQSFFSCGDKNQQPRVPSTNNGNGYDTPISMVGATNNTVDVHTVDDYDDEGSRSTTATNNKNKNKKVLYDDLGNPVEEDDVDINNDDDGFFPKTSSSAPRATPRGGSSGSQTPNAASASTSASASTGDDGRNDYLNPAAAASAAAAAAFNCSSANASSKSSTARGCRTNLICSNFAFMDNVMEAVGVAAVAAGVPPSCYNNIPTKCTGEGTGADAAAAYIPKRCKGCKPNLFCTGCSSTGCCDDNNNDNNNPPSAADADTSSGNPDIVSELNEAQRALGIYEPETYGPQPGRSPSRGGCSKFKRQSTPKHMRRLMQNVDDKLDAKEENKQQKKKNDDDNNNVSSDTYSTSRSDVESEITMGNTTVKNFGRNRSYGDNSIIQGEDYASLFDEENNDDKNEQHEQHAQQPEQQPEQHEQHEQQQQQQQQQHQPKKSSLKGSFSSMFEELKQVQKERSSLSSPYSGNDNKGHKFERKNSYSNISLSSIKKQLEKSNKKKSSVVTGSYLKSINNQANSAVTESRVDDETLLKSCRSSGVVASLKKQFDTRDPPSGGGLSFFNRGGIQPPTPRRNSTRSQYHQAYHQAFSPRTFASDDEIREEVSTTHVVSKNAPEMRHPTLEVVHRTQPPTPRRNSKKTQYHQAYHQAFGPRKIASDDEIREEVSTAHVVSKGPPVMRHSTLEIVTRTVAENDDNDIYLDQYEERQDRAVANSKKKSKSKKGSKSKKRFSLFKCDDKDESAQRPTSPMKKISMSLRKSVSKFKKRVQSVEGSRIQQDERDNTVNVKRTKPPAEIYYEA
jgi:hypothetical protein